MDKQTLSNYGWLVIVTLVLAIMLALATPFGSYVGDAVVSVANGMASTNEDATNEENITQESVEWSVKTDHGIDYNTFKYYNSIEDAINDVNSNDYSNGSNKLKSNSVVVSAPDGKIPVVRLVKNVEIKKQVNINNDMIIDGNNLKIFADNIDSVFDTTASVSFSLINIDFDCGNINKILGTTGDIKSFVLKNTNIKINKTQKLDSNSNGKVCPFYFTENSEHNIEIENVKATIKNNISGADFLRGYGINGSVKNIDIKIISSDRTVYGIQALGNSNLKINDSKFDVDIKQTTLQEYCSSILLATHNSKLNVNNVDINISASCVDETPFSTIDAFFVNDNGNIVANNIKTSITSNNVSRMNFLRIGAGNGVDSSGTATISNANVIFNSQQSITHKCYSVLLHNQKSGTINIKNSVATMQSDTASSSLCSVYDNSNTKIENCNFILEKDKNENYAIDIHNNGIIYLINSKLKSPVTYMIGNSNTKINIKNTELLHTIKEFYNTTTQNYANNVITKE